MSNQEGGTGQSVPQMIPDEAIEAALGVGGGSVMAVMNERAMVRRILEAAAPHLMAHAWELGMVSMYASTGGEYPLIPEQNPYPYV